MCESSKYLSRLTIGIDATNLLKGGGMTHLREVLRKALIDCDVVDKVVVWGRQETLDLLENRPWLSKISPPQLKHGWLLRILWQRFVLPKQVLIHECDILFVPGGNHSGKFSPVVAVSQNLLPFEWVELFRYGWTIMTFKFLILRWLQSRSFRQADGLIFLTHYAKKKISHCLGNSQAKSVIIPHGLSKRFNSKPKVQKSISEFSNTNPFRILYVSQIDQYKHQWNVVEAVSKLRQDGFPIVLDLVGSSYPPALTKLKTAIARLPNAIECVSYHGEIPYKELHKQYQISHLGIFASSCENLPNILLEVMASGLPIACSNRGPMPEILQKAGVYFNPEKPKDIQRALLNLIVSGKLREEKAKASYQLAQAYSWECCSEKTFGFICEIAKKYNSQYQR